MSRLSQSTWGNLCNQDSGQITIWLVVYLPLWKYEFVSWDSYSHYMEKQNVPNHQPEMPRIATTQLLTMAQMNTHDASWWTVAVVNTFSVPKVLGPGKSCLLNVALGDRIHDGTARIQLKKHAEILVWLEVSLEYLNAGTFRCCAGIFGWCWIHDAVLCPPWNHGFESLIPVVKHSDSQNWRCCSYGDGAIFQSSLRLYPQNLDV